MKKMIGIATLAALSLSVAQVASANVTAARTAVGKSRTVKAPKLQQARMDLNVVSNYLSTQKGAMALTNNAIDKLFNAGEINGEAARDLKATVARGVMGAVDMNSNIKELTTDGKLETKEGKAAFDKFLKVADAAVEELVRQGATSIDVANSTQVSAVKDAIADVLAQEDGLSFAAAQAKAQDVSKGCNLSGKLQ